MKNIENKALVKSVIVNKKFKSFIRAKLAKNVFIVDNNNDLTILYKKKKRTKKKKAKIKANLEGSRQILELKTLRHKRLKQLKINAYTGNSLVPRKSSRITAYYNLLNETKPFNIRLIKSIRGGYSVISSHGVKGFMYRKDFIRGVKILSCIERMKLKNLARICAYLIPKKTVSSFTFGATLKKLDFFIPRLRMSHKYFIPKYSGKLSATFSPDFNVNDKSLLKLVKKYKMSKPKTHDKKPIYKRKSKSTPNS